MWRRSPGCCILVVRQEAEKYSQVSCWKGCAENLVKFVMVVEADVDTGMMVTDLPPKHTCEWGAREVCLALNSLRCKWQNADFMCVMLAGQGASCTAESLGKVAGTGSLAP